MIPILYSEKEITETKGTTKYASSFGIGALTEATQCIVTEVRNGSYECSLIYPTSGRYSSKLKVDSIIRAKPNPNDPTQFFRVYGYSKPINGSIKYYLKHISNDLKYVVLPDFSTPNLNGFKALSEALSYSKYGITINTGFSCLSDVTDYTYTGYNSAINCDTPINVKAVLYDKILAAFETPTNQIEYHFNNFNIGLHKHRGTDTGLVVHYGGDIKECDIDIDVSEVYNRVLPYCIQNGVCYIGDYSELGNYGDSSFVKTIEIDVGEYITVSAPTMAQVSQAYSDWARYNSSPCAEIENITLDISTNNQLKNVSLCDIITVNIAPYNLNFKTKIVQTTYNCLTETYESIEIGNVRPTLSGIITGGSIK